MIPFKINGKRYQIPTTWSDVTFAQYLAILFLPESLRHQISLFTSIPIETLLKAEIKNLEKIALALSFINISPKLESGPSTMLGPYYIPKDITLESLGQFEALKELVQKSPKEFTTKEDYKQLGLLYAEACAIYLVKSKYKEFNSDKVPELLEEVMTFPCTEVLRTGSFFLFRPLNLVTHTETRSQNILRRLKKLIQGLPGYQKTLDSLQPSSTKAKE